MSRFRGLLYRLLHLPLPQTVLALIAGGAGVFYIFWNRLETSPIAYVVYVLSAYSVAVLAACIPGVIRRARGLAYDNPHSRRFFTDIPYRVRISLLGSLAVNLVFAVYKLITGILYASAWFVGVAVYYMVLSIVRFLLLRHMRMKSQDIRREWRQFRFSGCLLFLLNIALAGIIWQMIYSGKGYFYPGTLIYAVAAYTFYSLVMAIASLIRFRKLNIPAVSAAKIISLSTALVSVYSLQTAMFASFGGDPFFQRLMNSLVGGGICLLVFFMAVYMVIKAKKHCVE